MKTTILTILILGTLVSCNGTKNDYDASGIFEATEIIVSSEAGGKIMQLDLTEGDVLKRGQETGYIDSTQLYLKKLQLQKSMGASRSRRTDIDEQVAAIDEQIRTQLREKARVKSLIESHAANTKQLDDIEAQISVLEKELAAKRSTLSNNNRGVNEESSALEIQIAQTEDLLRKCRITSPIEGTVLVKYAEAGELATQGTPLFKIADIGNMILRAYITSGQLTGIKTGDAVRVFADYGDEGRREYEGRITWISDQAEFTPKTIQTRDERANLVYAVKIAVRNDGLLKIGMYADVIFK